MTFSGQHKRFRVGEKFTFTEDFSYLENPIMFIFILEVRTSTGEYSLPVDNPNGLYNVSQIIREGYSERVVSDDAWFELSSNSSYNLQGDFENKTFRVNVINDTIWEHKVHLTLCKKFIDGSLAIDPPLSTDVKPHEDSGFLFTMPPGKYGFIYLLNIDDKYYPLSVFANEARNIFVSEVFKSELDTNIYILWDQLVQFSV